MKEDVSRVMAPYKSKFFAVFLLECILAVLIIGTALTIKFFIPDTFKEAKKWYEKNMTADTRTEEITKGVYNED